jgi:hypothetical protein
VDTGSRKENASKQRLGVIPSRAIWSRAIPIAGGAALGENTSRGLTDVNDKDRPMPPLIAFAGALGGLAVVRWAYKTAQRINRELEEARLARVAEAVRTGDIPTLKRDPVTGAYRPG